MSSDAVTRPEPPTLVEAFAYVDASAFPAATGNESSRLDTEKPEGAHASSAELQARAREEGLHEGEQRARAVFEKEAAQLRARVQMLVVDFAQERDRYFERAEGEVVRLSLGIARKILQRESQADPLLLTGLVRVALDQLDKTSRVELRVHPSIAREWRDYFSHTQSLHAPDIVEDTALEAGTCLLVAEVGTTEISITRQLEDIEQGFLDLLAERPRTSAREVVQ